MSNYIENTVLEDKIKLQRSICLEVKKERLLLSSYEETVARLKVKNKQPTYWKPDLQKISKLERRCKDIDDELALMFYKVAWGVLQRYRFDVKDEASLDMAQDIVLDLLDKKDRFNFDYVNPTTGQKSRIFNYLSTVAINCLWQAHRSKKRNLDLLAKLKEAAESGQLNIFE